MNAVDTNVLVYAFDSDEPVKQKRAMDLLDQLVLPPIETILLWQVVAEFLACLRKWEAAAKLSGSEAETYLNRVLSMFPLVVPNLPVVHRSVDLSRRYSLSHWDSMLLAACIEAGGDTLYSEDLGDGVSYDSVTVINPLK